jgi:hypothetical protein
MSRSLLNLLPKIARSALRAGNEKTCQTRWFRDFDASLRSKHVVSLEHQVMAMAIEHARARALPKPWGVLDRRPWSDASHDGGAIGEIWYERPDNAVADPSLLLKLLFTGQPLSIQVHPGDAFAHSIGLPNGKTEAWYVLSAAPEAKGVALGLKRRLTPQQLREAVENGSISDLVVWRAVSTGDVIFVPAGTIQAIGAGLVIAELQQRSDATFRLFDHGRERAYSVGFRNAVTRRQQIEFLRDNRASVRDMTAAGGVRAIGARRVVEGSTGEPSGAKLGTTHFGENCDQPTSARFFNTHGAEFS